MPDDLRWVNYRYVFPFIFRANVHILKLLSPERLYKWIVGREHYDVVISYLQSPTMRIVSGRPKSSGTKIVNWIHNEFMSIKDLSFMYRSKDEFHRSMKRFDHTVFVADSARTSLCKMLPYLSDESSTIYNVVESDEIVAKSREAVESGFFKSNEFNIISVGRFSKAKAFHRLIHVTKTLRNANIPAHLYLLGKGDLETQYQQEISNLNLADNVTIVGFRENPYKYVAKAALFVCSSLHEGFSTAVTESLIVGTPVVTTLCSGMEELLGANGEYGIITPNEEQALSDAVVSIAKSPTLLKSLKDKAIARGKSFSKEKAVADVINLLNKVCPTQSTL